MTYYSGVSTMGCDGGGGTLNGLFGVALNWAVGRSVIKKLPLASLIIFLALATGPALAAPPSAWTGCYVDAGVGYGMWAQSHYAESDPGFAPFTPSTTSGGEGWLGRFGGGCDYQFAVPKLGNVIVGILGDYDVANISGNFQETVSVLEAPETETGAWAVGGRLGYLLTPNFLTYVDGGYTQARFSQIGLITPLVPPIPTPIGANTYSGWFLGSGFDYALNADWLPIHGLFLRTEYRYARYGSADLPIQPVGFTGTAENMQKDVQTVTVSLIWRLNWNDPLDTGAANSRALAADLPLKAPRITPPPVTWTGCYIGAGVGYGMWTQNHYPETDPGFVQELPPTTGGGEGWLGRGGGGCDYQFAVPKLGNFVVGVLGDYDLASLSGTFQEAINGFLGAERESGAWAIGGRLGYLPTPDLLAYVAGGYTQARFQPIELEFDAVPPVATIFSAAANTYQGWFVEGGAEYALNMDWIPVNGLFWRTEYRYAGYAPADVPFLPLPLTLTAEKMHNNVQTATTSLIWRFNWPAASH